MINIDINGPQGNAFALMGTAVRLAKQLDYSKSEIAEMTDEMKKGSYQHLLQTFEGYFGEYVQLVDDGGGY